VRPIGSIFTFPPAAGERGGKRTAEGRIGSLIGTFCAVAHLVREAAIFDRLDLTAPMETKQCAR
jgi:hypothetical protein